MKISCKQFEDLIPFYLNDELSESLKNAFVEHLHNCPNCHIKFNMLNSIVNDLKDAYNQIIIETEPQESLEENDNENYQINTELSAYIDNELNEDASVQLRKNIIAKPALRKKIDNLYSLKKMMTNSFNEEKNRFKFDFSKDVLKKLEKKHNINNESYTPCYLFLGVVLSALVISFIILQSLL